MTFATVQAEIFVLMLHFRTLKNELSLKCAKMRAKITFEANINFRN